MLSVSLGSSEKNAKNQGVLRFAKFCWVGKHINVIMKPTNSPTQPKKSCCRLKIAFGPLFPTANIFSWVKIGFTYGRKQTTRNRTQPNSPQTPY